MKDFLATVRDEMKTLLSTRTFYFLVGLFVAKGDLASVLGALKDFAGF